MGLVGGVPLFVLCRLPRRFKLYQPLAFRSYHLSGSNGDPGAVVTPTLADRGAWDLTTSFPEAGYFAVVSVRSSLIMQYVLCICRLSYLHLLIRVHISSIVV